MWRGSRHDIMANVSVLFAACGVGLVNSPWPDMSVGLGIVVWFLRAAIRVLKAAISAYAAPNPYKASCCQEAYASLCETVRHVFARPRVHRGPVDSLCLISATRFRDQKRSCTTHLLRCRPPPASGGGARSVSWRRLETLRCPCAAPVNAAGSACVHTVQ